MDGNMHADGPFHHRQHYDDNHARFSGQHNHHNMHANDNYSGGGPPYANNTGAVGTHTSGAIAGPARQHQQMMHQSERLPTALDRIFALQKVRLTELGFADNFDLAATAVSTEAASAQHDSAYHSSDDTHDRSKNADSVALDAAAVARRKKKNLQKKEKQKNKKKQQQQQKQPTNSSETHADDQASSLTENVEIEYVPEEITFDADDSSTSSVAKEFSRVFTAFQQLSAGRGNDDDENNTADADKNGDAAPNVKLTKVPVDLHEADDEDDAKATKKNETDSEQPLSRRRLKKLLRPSVARLKQQVERPDVVEFHDVTSPDPKLLIFLKAYRSTVPVPRHWCFKRKYLAGKRGFEKPPFELPDFIRKTGITEMREARAEKDSGKTLKQQMREKVRPKMGKIDINYQKLHDAFFKWQTKPRVSIHGDVYYEGKETEARLRDKKPGVISNDLRLALGMPVGPNAQKYPPPWLIAMQRYGPPPSYPELKVPGLNAPIPEGCTFGYHAGGWGKPPVDERGRPLYGDVFGTSGGAAAAAEKPDEYETTVTKLWGELQYDESDEESEAESDMDEEPDNADEAAGKKAATEGGDAGGDGTATTAAGLVTPMSGTQSSVLAGGLETPAEIELRKQRIETEMEAGDDQRPLYTVLPEKRADKLGGSAMMGSMHLYDLRAANAPPPSGKTGGVGDVTLAIDPSELEQHGGLPRANDVEKRYQAQLDQQRQQLEKEDFSDMVAEHAARQAQKRRKQQQDSSKTTTTKKSKDFKF